MLTEAYNTHVPRWARILIQIFTFGEAGAVYRILMFVDDCIAKKEQKNIFALVVGIIGAVTMIGTLILWVIDMITVIGQDKYSVLTGAAK